MAFYGVGLDVKVKELNLQFKMHIQNKPSRGIRYFRHIFKKYDENGNKKLDAQEFEECLGAFGLFPKKVEMQALMKYYDTDGDGHINIEEFMRGLRDELTERRAAMVEKAFNIMDRDGSGQITVKDIAHLYDVSQHREFIEGTKTKQEILEDFLDGFDGARGNDDGVVNKEEWYDYYTDLGVSIPSDDYFVQILESTWNICEDEDDQTYHDKIAQYTEFVHSQLKNLTGGSTDEGLISKIYEDFDLNGNGIITIYKCMQIV